MYTHSDVQALDRHNILVCHCVGLCKPWIKGDREYSHFCLLNVYMYMHLMLDLMSSLCYRV